MKTLALVTLAALLSSGELNSLAANTPAQVQSPFPIPPQQTSDWKPATNDPPSLGSAVQLLFANGLADPRGCDYREIEILVGDAIHAFTRTVHTHGWVLPKADGATNDFAIGWNGQIYQTISIGKPADAEADAREELRNVNRDIFHYQRRHDEASAVDFASISAVKAAMILRLASGSLAGDCARTFGPDDPFLIFASDHLWTAFDRGVGAHVRGDDDVASAVARSATAAQTTYVGIAQKRGLSWRQVVKADTTRESPNLPEPLASFPFLYSLPALVRDQEQRHLHTAILATPTNVAPKAARIAKLIDQLDDLRGIGGSAWIEYNYDNNPTLLALINEGWDAVEPLLDCYEKDERLTRLLPRTYAYSVLSERRIIGVYQPAYLALEGILETPRFNPGLDGTQSPQETADVRTRTAAAMREYYKKYRGMSRIDRLYAELQDERGRWLEAASILVLPTNAPVRRFDNWNSILWTSPVNPDDPTPIYGEPLRTRSNPSVSELLAKRAAESAARSDSNDDVGPLNEACNIGICLARWHPQAALPVLRHLSQLSIKVLAPGNGNNRSDHIDLYAKLPLLTIVRARAGDTNALSEYVRWFRTTSPDEFFAQRRDLLNPFKYLPDDPAFVDLWPFLLEDEKSPWCQFLRHATSLEVRPMAGWQFGIEEWFGAPVINNQKFRNFVIRLLHDKSHCGTIRGGGPGSYDLDEPLSTDRGYGYVVQLTDGAPSIDGLGFRICDFYAWILSHRVVGASAFEIYWNEPDRDAGIATLVRMLENTASKFKTQPFQER